MASHFDEAQKLGAIGWELVSVTQGADFIKYYLKRPLEKK